MSDSQDKLSPWRILGATWGLSGFMWLMIKAIVGLGALSTSALSSGLTLFQWFVLLLNVGFMAYSEGYKGFQKSFSPRLAARVKYLASSGNTMQLVLAPLFCMSFFHASKKRLIISYSLLVGIITLVILFRLLPQPWRGILDAGVVIGLSWGLIATLWFCFKEFIAPDYSGDPEISYQ